MNSLVGVLCRFREKPIAIMGDVKRMFHQFRVDPPDCLWLKNQHWSSTLQNESASLWCIKFTRLCKFCIKEDCCDHKGDLNSEVCNFLTNNFYADDGLNNCKNYEEAIKLVQDARNLCSNGNLRLDKIMSNSRKVMQSIPRDFGSIIHRELHHFLDSSSSGWLECSYLSLVNEYHYNYYMNRVYMNGFDGFVFSNNIKQLSMSFQLTGFSK